MTLAIRSLTPEDIPVALHLSDQADWNQLAADWKRMVDLWPNTCFGGWEGSRLVGTSTLACFGRTLGWVGMVLVDQACRGKGYGTVMLDAAINAGRTLDLVSIGLDATHLGEPLYLNRGFIMAHEVQRWHRPAEGTPTDLPKGFSQAIGSTTILAVSDRHATGLDRHALLAYLQQEEGAHTYCISANEIEAYGFTRMGRAAGQVGPIAARSVQAADQILQDACHDLLQRNPRQPIIIDTSADTPLAHRLAALGFKPARTLKRMYLGRPPTPAHPQWRPYAGAGFELG